MKLAFTQVIFGVAETTAGRALPGCATRGFSPSSESSHPPCSSGLNRASGIPPDQLIRL
jgi:hypothetical protein